MIVVAGTPVRRRCWRLIAWLRTCRAAVGRAAFVGDALLRVATCVHQSTLNFNKELLLGECGALLVANFGAVAVSHYTHRAGVISASAVVGTLLGGTLFWLGARIWDQVRAKSFHARGLASDIGYFTPGAIVLGFLVYDPAIYLTSHHFLLLGGQVGWAVVGGQILAFGLFLISMNLYRAVLLKVRGKRL